MNELTKNIQKMMVPKAAIIAYKYEDRRNSDTRYFIELRPIGKSGQMGAGIPVTYEFMNTLLESYTEEMSGIPAGRAPENMLACNPRKGQEEYIWYNPPRKRQMFFHKESQYTGRHVQSAGNCLPCKKRKPWTCSPQGKTSGGNDTAVPCPVLQRDRIKCLPWQQLSGKATEPDFPFPAGILGKTVLADRILPSGRKCESYSFKSCHRHREHKKQSVRHERTQAHE